MLGGKNSSDERHRTRGRIFNPCRTKLPASDRKMIEEQLGRLEGLIASDNPGLCRPVPRCAARFVCNFVCKLSSVMSAYIAKRTHSTRTTRQLLAGVPHPSDFFTGEVTRNLDG